jgi:3-methyladenine DNA glycosylase AlkD
MNVKVVVSELAKYADQNTAKDLKRFFKTRPGEYGEGDLFLGIRAPVLRRLAKKHRALSLTALGQLLRSDYHEERLLALCVMILQAEVKNENALENLYRLYLENTGHVNNWDLVDCSAPHIVGRYLQDRSRAPLYKLAASSSLWERRIAIISTFHYIRQGEFADALRIAELLLADNEDLIHKAAGWMLREVGKRSPPTAEAFLDKHCRAMPRTMLRYAIEKFPKAKRLRYLKGIV